MSDLLKAAEKERRRWSADTSDAAAWDARALVDALRKAGHLDDAVRFGEDALGRWERFEPLRSALSWALYTRTMAPLSETSDLQARRNANKTLARIEALATADPHGTYSPWPLAVLRLSGVLAERWPAAALKLLDRLEPALLSAELSGGYPSLRSRWHLGVTKALEALGRWDELLAACEAAEAAQGSRPADLRWVSRRQAAALEAKGDLLGAAAILRELRGQLREWYVDADLARVLNGLGEKSEAIDACRRALAPAGDLAARWRTLTLLAELLADTDRSLSDDHIQLARVLRRDAGWPEDEQLTLIARRRGLTDDPPPTIDVRPLRAGWRKALDPLRVTGIVKSVLAGGGSGFIIRDDSKGDLYFRMPGTRNAPSPGTRVSFRIVDAFDAKKGQASHRADDVRTEP